MIVHVLLSVVSTDWAFMLTISPLPGLYFTRPTNRASITLAPYDSCVFAGWSAFCGSLESKTTFPFGSAVPLVAGAAVTATAAGGHRQGHNYRAR